MTVSAASRPITTMIYSRISLTVFVLFILTKYCSTEMENGPFQLRTKTPTFCVMENYYSCAPMRWTTGQRLMSISRKKCFGAQGTSVGSGVSLYDCDEKSSLQKWECRNETLVALKGEDLYIEINEDRSATLSKTIGPNNRLTISRTTMGACTRTHRELFTIGGNAFGKICMFPFLYKDVWYGDCTTFDSSHQRPWCGVETRYENELWGYCPSTSRDHWVKNLVTGEYYQINSNSALTWAEAERSCKQQGASLVSITDPNQQAYISALLGTAKQKLWIGAVLDPNHGWQWSNGKPYRYLRWSAGNPQLIPGHNCGLLDTAGQHLWQSSTCGKKMGYICYQAVVSANPTQIEQGFCSSPWIPYNGHCFHLQRSPQKWSDAQVECRKEGGDLVSIRNVEDQSFVISQLGYASTDELWIGLNDRVTEGLFDWSDHSKVSFSSWGYGKPAVSTQEEDCVLIRGESGNWADRSCDEKHGFICMKQSGTQRPSKEVELDMGCQAGWRRHGSYCYLVGMETKTFNEAKDSCQNYNSYLADVSNGVDNAFLVSLVGLRPERYFWLGLSNQKNKDEFVWTNVNVVKFTHWNTNMPGYQQGCVAITTGVLAGLWDLLPCTNKEKYICKHLAEGALQTAPPPTQTPAKCAEGWMRSGVRNLCYKFFTGPRSHEKTWYEAREYCKALGGDLLSIHSSEELFVGRFHGRGWIGLHVPDPSVGYVWTDGSPVNFQHWQEGEPNNFNNEESCVEYDFYQFDQEGSWNDAHCERYNDWLCQIRAGVTPKPPPNATVEFNTTVDGWLEWNGNQYYINRRSLPMEEARHFCQQRHGDLLSVTSKEENTFIWKQISRAYGKFYIGLSVDLDGSFWWMDQTPLSVQRWDENQPNSDAFDESCVVMAYYRGLWHSCNCGQDNMSICKRGSVPLTNTTAAPTVPPKGGCPIKWKKFDSKCYSINDRKITWEDAMRQCISIGGNLASIPTRRVQAFLMSNMAEVSTSDLWIGLNNLKQAGFYWTDGKPRRYTNWGYSKIRRHPGSFYQRYNEEDCVMMTNNPSLGIGKWLIRSCNDTYGFICARNVDPNIADQPQPAVPKIYVSVGNDSIKAVTKDMSWDEAKRNCEGEKANLVNLRNGWTWAYVQLLAINLNAPLWIGLNKQLTGGYFKYIDGWHLNFAYWATDEPKTNRSCVYVDVDGTWKTDFCNRTLNSVCMQSTDVAPTDSTKFPGVCPEEVTMEQLERFSWLPFKGHCYLFVTEETEWPNAASSCAMHGGVLASIEDPSEQKFIQNNVKVFQDSHTSFWIGLLKSHKGAWIWLDKTVLDYANWDADELDFEYGLLSTLDGSWRTGHRWFDRPYICKTPKVMPGDRDLKPEPHGGDDPGSRVHTTLIVVLTITVTSSLIAVGFFIYKKSPHVLPTFDNPLYFNSERSKPDVVDTNRLIENATEETPEPIVAL